MQRPCLPLALTLALTGSVAHADPVARATEPLQDNSSAPAHAEQAPTERAETRPKFAAAADLDSEIPREPRGELVRIARHPEAELLVNVLLTTNDQRSYFELVSEGTGASLIVCGSPCRFRIWPGRYRLITNASARYVGGVNQLVIESDSLVSVRQPTVYRPILGAIVGVLGLAGVLTGAVLLTSYQCGGACEMSESRGNRLGFAALSAGAVLTPFGWWIFGQGRNPELDVAPTRASLEQ
jgi:hypothetical protein